MVRGNGTEAVGGEGVPEGLLSAPGSSRARIDPREILDRAREVPEALDRVNNQFVEFVREKPLVALGAAVGVGYLLGRALRRWV